MGGGIDLGLLDFAVTSDGSKYQNPRHLKKHERNLKRKQRKLSRKKDKTTNKRRKAKLAVAKVHAKIARVREYFRHKLSRKIVNENQVIVVENLAVKNMVKNPNLAKSISDAGWGMFCTMLKYKAEAEGKIYLEVGRFFPSSHLCSETLLSLPKMDLFVREFDCPCCSKRHDRDINAAINIKNEGLRILSTLGTSVAAKGGNVRPKQYGRKSTTIEAVALEFGTLRCAPPALRVRSDESRVVHRDFFSPNRTQNADQSTVLRESHQSLVIGHQSVVVS
jgi:putative transposase